MYNKGQNYNYENINTENVGSLVGFFRANWKAMQYNNK